MIKMTEQERILDILNKFEFFQGQRAGRELWNNKPKEVQDKDMSDFIKDINYIRSYLQDSVVLSKEEYERITKELVTEQRATEIAKEYFEKMRKETAEKDFNTIVKALEERKGRVEAFYGVAESVGVDIAIRTVKELAKQFGIKIKE